MNMANRTMLFLLLAISMLICFQFDTYVDLSGRHATPDVHQHVRLWFFTVDCEKSSYMFWSKVAVISAKQNSNLLPCMMLIGRDLDFEEWMRAQGVVIAYVVPENFALFRQIRDDTVGKGITLHVGAWIRLFIPQILENETLTNSFDGIPKDYILYTDTDVIFLDDVYIDYQRLPKQLSFAIQGDKYFSGDPYLRNSHLNSGVMIMNVSGYRESYPEFEQYISYYASTEGSNFTRIGDQGLLKHFYPLSPKWTVFDLPTLLVNHRTYFLSIFSKYHSTALPKILEWEPYLGVNEDAVIIHFHGPKFALEGCNDINVSWSYTNAHLHKMMHVEKYEKLRRILNFEGLQHYGRMFLHYGSVVCLQDV